MTPGDTDPGILARFARHPVAANLLMALMILTGVYALVGVNTQFFPNFDLGRISVSVAWQGASAADMEDGVTRPLEQELRNLDHLKSITSTSAEGISRISLEFEQGADMGEALEQAKSRVGQVRNLPEEAEEPEVARVTRFDPVAKVLVYAKAGDDGPERLAELRQRVQNMRDELLDRGIAKVDIRGLPEQKIAIRLPPARLHDLGLTLPEIADRVDAQSVDLPAGEVGETVPASQLRSEAQRRRTVAFEDIVVRGSPETGRLPLGDIATIELADRDDTIRVTYQGRPAVELDLKRSTNGDTLEAARTLQRWAAETRPTLPPGVGLATFDESWSLLQERIMLLIKNGATGLILVLLVLFLFLRGWVATWVALGIPTAFLAALALLYAFGGSINMISLFAFIMTLGIIVDDAIVVGEQALSRYQEGGESAVAASVNAARRMWPPVLSSSLTTIAAFLPLMLVGGVIGNILFDIPFVLICVILASLVEAFLVLPGHLAQTFPGMTRQRTGGGFRARFDTAFNRFRDGPFRRAVERAVAWRMTTLASGVALLLMTTGLLAGDRLLFSFFPSPDSNVLYGNVKFVAGTPERDVNAFIDHLRETLYATDDAVSGEPVHLAVARRGTTAGEQEAGGSQSGDQFGALVVELVNPSQREITASAFLERWRQRVEPAAGLETLNLTVRSSGPPGRDLSIRLTGAAPEPLKAAANELGGVLEGFAGVSSVTDDMPYGRQQILYRLNDAGQAAGLTEAAVGQQLRAAYAGDLAQIFTRGEDELEVRVGLSEQARDDPAALGWLPIKTPEGDMVPLEGVVDFTTERGFEALRHAEAQLAVQVQGDVDEEVTNANRILDRLKQGPLARISTDYGVDWEYTGRAEDQRETLTDMKRGLVLGLVLIYLVLAAVFASYIWPLVVMAVIPFGLVGALTGHWLLGIDLTILSLFGIFGLSGIVVNNSIILVSFYRDLRAEAMGVYDALVGASCRRLRPMLLTSLTTMGGLTPLLFETSLQAQFLIPMAVSLVFGLAFATLMVLFLVPAMLSLEQDLAARFDPRP
jgi:multidrug efflux pump subunit AcrB